MHLEINVDKLEEYFKKKELYSNIRVSSPYIAVRCDGRNFHKLTQYLGFKKPYDKRFAVMMVLSTLKVMDEVDAVKLAYLFSDEVNFIFKSPYPYNGRIEKLDSIIASILGGAFTALIHLFLNRMYIASFDARIIPLDDINEIISYLVWRQLTCFRNCLNSYAQYVLLKFEGLSRRKTAKMLEGVKGRDLIKIIERYIDFNRVPLWHKRGILITYTEYVKLGYDPIRRRHIKCRRRKAIVLWGNFSFHSKDNLVLQALG